MVLHFVQIYSIISFIVTLFFIVLQFFISYDSKFFSITLPKLLQKSRFSNVILLIILSISRYFTNLSFNDFKQFSLFSASLLFLFNLTRFNILINNFPQTAVGYFFIVVIYIICFLNSFIRMSIFLGIAIDAKIENNIVFTWEHIPKFFRTAANYIQNHTTTNAGSNIPKGDNLKRYGIWAGVVMVPLAGYSAYELHLSRVAAERSAAAAETAAKAAEIAGQAVQQQSDIKAVKHGLMDPQTYHKKYPQN